MNKYIPYVYININKYILYVHINISSQQIHSCQKHIIQIYSALLFYDRNKYKSEIFKHICDFDWHIGKLFNIFILLFTKCHHVEKLLFLVLIFKTYYMYVYINMLIFRYLLYLFNFWTICVCQILQRAKQLSHVTKKKEFYIKFVQGYFSRYAWINYIFCDIFFYFFLISWMFGTCCMQSAELILVVCSICFWKHQQKNKSLVVSKLRIIRPLPSEVAIFT